MTLEEVAVQLPQGDLGLELQPTVKTNLLAVGCKIKGWKQSPKAKNIVPGSKIVSVDGSRVENSAFEEIVSLLQSSTQRRLVLQRPIESNGCENIHPNTIASVTSSLHKKEAPIASEYGVNKKIGACNDSSLSRIALLEKEIKNARDEVNAFKIERRGNEGQISLLKYQLDKTRNEKCENIPAEEVSIQKPCESFWWMKHSTQYRDVMHEIMKRSSKGHTEADNDVQELRKNLHTQVRVSYRLEMQLRTWVESQIELQKKLACEDTEKYYTDKRTTECTATIPAARHESRRKAKYNNENGLVETRTNDSANLTTSHDDSQEKWALTDLRSSDLNNVDTHNSESSRKNESFCMTLRSNSKFVEENDHLNQVDISAQGPTYQAHSSYAHPFRELKQEKTSSNEDTRHISKDSPPVALSTPSANRFSGEDRCNEQNILSPQLYRAILSSHSKKDRRNGEKTLISKRSRAADGKEEAPRSNMNEPHKNDNRYSRHQNDRSRALKERMQRLKQESNKIRDDLRRFRSTMQNVRDECKI